MALSEYRRRLIASALIASKRYLAADEHQLRLVNKCQHICSALHRVDTVGAKMACDVIADRLDGKQDTVYQWLKRRGYSSTTDQIQAYRHRWLNALIEEFTAPVDPLLDPKNRRKVAHAFKRAKVKIRQHTFICLALERQDTEGAEMAKAIIQQRLGRSHYSLDAWVHQHIDAEACGSQVHQFRLRWLDALIDNTSSTLTMSIYPTELVAQYEFEMQIFERPSIETSKKLMHEVKLMHAALTEIADSGCLGADVAHRALQASSVGKVVG